MTTNDKTESEGLLEMTICHLAGHTGEPAAELRRKLDSLTAEEHEALITYLGGVVTGKPLVLGGWDWEAVAAHEERERQREDGEEVTLN